MAGYSAPRQAGGSGRTGRRHRDAQPERRHGPRRHQPDQLPRGLGAGVRRHARRGGAQLAERVDEAAAAEAVLGEPIPAVPHIEGLSALDQLTNEPDEPATPDMTPVPGVRANRHHE